MKNHISALCRLAVVALTAYPAFAMAVPSSTSPYNTDVTNKYVQDQTSKVMSNLNGILCYMGAMIPDQMVNLATNSGNYIALIDQNVCDSSKGSGGQSDNTGPAYTAAVVNSSRVAGAPMLVKVWVSPQEGNDISVYASATQAPSATLPYGIFRMDYCGGASCASDKGFINAASSGTLSFYSAGTHGGGDSETTALILNATSTTDGSGAINESFTSSCCGSGGSNFKFAYNFDYFIRNDSTTDQCFDRSPANAAESVWRYGLYDSTTGAQITRNSGFPIEYTDGAGVTSNGYIGYNGLWMPVTVPSLSTVQQVTYGNGGATKTPYTLVTTGGKLMKYTTATTTLAALNKVTFWYFAQNTIAVSGGGTITAMNSGTQYELYWDNANSRFAVSGQQGTSGNMQPLATPGYVTNAAMLTANPWGLFGWSQMMGGMFGINGSDFAALTTPTTAIPTPSDIPVKTQTQDIVYPSQFAALGNLTCINDCPTAALIATSNASTSGGSAFEPATAGWTQIGSGSFTTYTLDPATGNLIDPASGVVVSAATTGTNANGIRSGRLLATADVTADFNAMIAAKNAAGVCGGTCSLFNQGDVDFLPTGKSYYVWETGGNPWNQIAILKDQTTGTPVAFDPPLQVSFVVPTGAKYGSYQGATISLQYGGFGDLWGIPNECVDITSNSNCDFTKTMQYQQQNFRWTPHFSIPFDATTGVVTSGATTYLVKPLDMEVRLANISCSTAGMPTLPAGTVTLPLASDFILPTIGVKPTFTTVPAPQVIHGVKQY